MNATGTGVPIIGQGSRVQIRAMTIIHACAVDTLPEPLPGFPGTVTLRVVDVVNGHAMFLPMDRRAADTLITSLRTANQTGPTEAA